jgi:hypothetical protein
MAEETFEQIVARLGKTLEEEGEPKIPEGSTWAERMALSGLTPTPLAKKLLDKG